MANTKIQKEMTGIVQNFISLWNRYYTLYLENVSRQDITSEKENEFLKFQGTIVEQLVYVLELDEKSRFDIHDKVMSVINEVVSLDFYTRMSEFQINRTKRQWQEAMEELEKLYRFCDTYDSKIDKVQRITEVKKKNPYWDPTQGGLRDVLSRIAVAPVTFFQGIKMGVPAEKIGSFMFFTFLTPIMIILTIVFLINFSTVKIIGRNVVVEAGLLASDETGFIPSVIIAAAILAGLLIISVSLCVLFLILHYIYSWFLHFGFRLTGAKESYAETYKAVTYGAAPVIAAVTAPYTIILQIIGASRVHKYPYVLSAIGWLIGTILFIALLFTALGGTFYFTGAMPQLGDEFAYVLEKDTDIYSPDGKTTKAIATGTWLPISDKKPIEKPKKVKIEDYCVEYDGKTYFVEEGKTRKTAFSIAKMPGFIISRCASSIGVVRDFLNEIIKKYSE